ncbi:MAG: hypothetical protein P8M65_03255 [Roseibacillus sp.]|nr:hypothetical protein [Roseibacillus sp.]
MMGSITSVKRLTVIAVVGVIVSAVSSTTRVVTAMRAPSVAIAVIGFVNPNIVVAEKAVVIATMVVTVAVAVMGGSVRVIYTRAQKNGAEQADGQGQEALHECRTRMWVSLFGRIWISQYRISSTVTHSWGGHSRSLESGGDDEITVFTEKTGAYGPEGTWPGE